MSPDPKTVREIATEHILDDVRRAHDIGAAVLGHYGPDALTKHEYGAYCSAIREAIATATVAVSWPDELQPADVVTAEQQQDGAATEAAGRVTAFCDALDHYGDDGNPIASEHNTDRDPDTVLYLTLTKQDLRAVLAERTALAARVAELEGEREADTCAVGSLLEADDEDVPRARKYLRSRFADRIDALIKRDDAKAGESL